MLLLYGAYGYTGELVARLAAARGLRPVLAGRSAAALEPLARELSLPHRAFGLDEPAVLDAALDGIRVVLHCAGPFSRTSAPMAEACLRRKVHYLDVTGEIPVFESLAARDREAKAAGVMLLPGVGFDVVPSDCLAAHLKRRLPSARRLALGFESSGRFSHGTATTIVENLPHGGAVRRDGRIVRVPLAWKARVVDFGRGPRTAITIPWGDVATAFHSTGIPDVEVYLAAPRSLRWGLRIARPFAPLLAAGAVQSFLKGRIKAGPRGPSVEERARTRSYLWGEVEDDAGGRAVSRLETPEGYALTARTALAIAETALRGEVTPGFQTPSRAYGPDFILSFDGVSRRDD
ncbi:MAG: saccharopine dehydrogenase NADP-binding domain-containing protein [Acidobacteria bacterium]|nr:saccharopine dehydrogenase NADP-binding domain-containing protein [Acidobacteriota bacterium]